MPGYDRTGPRGAGPGTGGGWGLCFNRPGRGQFFGSLPWRGIGRGSMPWGGGRGRCFGGRGGWGGRFAWGGTPSPSDEVEMLRADLSAAKEQVAAMQARLSELEGKE